ncbi:MAG: glycosyltransferase family 4 protein [Armatimonadota bacterium]|nr:glycosyltransferase family 4 protein [Armatimonadota bacterium]
MKTRVLMIGPALTVKGGMSSVAIAIIENLSADFEVTFLPTYAEGGKLKAGWAFLAAVARARGLARSHDLAHIHFSKKGSTFRKAVVARIIKSTGTPLLLHSHSSSYGFFDSLPGFLKSVVSAYLASADRFIALSESWAKHYTGKGANPNRVVVLPNPVVIPKSVDNREGRDTVTFIFMGAMGDRKGAFDLAEAFVEVGRLRPNARLIMAGNGEVDRVRNILKEGGVYEQCEIYDWVGPEERDRLLRQADAFILPSYNEGLPMAMLEAIGYELAPIVTPVGGIPEVIESGRNGLLVEPGDKEAIASAMLRLTDDGAERVAMGAAARRTAEDYDIEKYIAEMENIYRDLASNKVS